MAIDIFTSRTMLRALKTGFKPRTFLSQTFFAHEDEHETESIDITIEKGKRTMAVFVSPIAEGRVVSDLGRLVKTYKTPYLKPKRKTSAEDLLKRSSNVHIYQPESLQTKSAKKLGEDLSLLGDTIERRIEWMCAKALIEGKVVVIGYTDEGDDASLVYDEIDFKRSASHDIVLTGTDLWSDDASKPLKHLNSFKRMVAKETGLTARVVVMGDAVADRFLDHPDLEKKLDNRRIKLGEINPEALPDGVTYLGYLNYPGVDVYAYDEWYVDPLDDTEKPMVPSDSLILGATNARAVRHFGPIMDMDAIDSNMTMGKWFPKSWREKDPSCRWVMLQSSPLPIPHQIDAFVHATVL